MPYIRESAIWAPLYLFLIYFAFQNFGKQAVLWVLASIIVVALTDFVSSNMLKNFFQIPRPCRDSFLDPVSNLRINRCPTSYSFTSSHATNHFGVASFWFATLKRHVPWVRWFYVWAAVICYAQIYVGVHFPIDVLAGGLLGAFLGNIVAHMYNYKFTLIPLYKQNQL